jgi:hypothetical protein
MIFNGDLSISYLPQLRGIPAIRGRISFLIQKARPVYTPSRVVRRAVRFSASKFFT